MARLLRVSRLLFCNLGGPTVYDTVAETDIANISVPGGLIQPGECVHFIAAGRIYNNTGVDQTAQLRAYFGGTLGVDTTAVILSTSIDARVWLLDVLIKRSPTPASDSADVAGMYQVTNADPGAGGTVLVTTAQRRAMNNVGGVMPPWGSGFTLRLTGQLSAVAAMNLFIATDRINLKRIPNFV